MDPNLVAVLSTLLFKFHVAKPNGICDFFFVLDISFNEKAKMMKLQDLKKNHCRLTTSLFTVNLGVFYE